MAGHFNFNFGSGADPLLGGHSDFSSQFRDIEQQQALLEERKKHLAELAQNAQAEEGRAVSQTPIWDEIDTITANMSEAEFAELQNSDEFKESSKALMEYVGALQLKAIKPLVEKSDAGKKLLEHHLATVKVLKSTASKKVEEELSTFKEYTEKYSHLTFEDYLKTKGKKK